MDLLKGVVNRKRLRNTALVDLTCKNSMALFKNMHLFPNDFLEFSADQGSINPALMMQKASSVQWPLPMIMLNVALL